MAGEGIPVPRGLDVTPEEKERYEQLEIYRRIYVRSWCSTVVQDVEAGGRDAPAPEALRPVSWPAVAKRASEEANLSYFPKSLGQPCGIIRCAVALRV